ncbi:MAG: 16S rRNA (cytosine(1402)-N(4))-methyltransferase RsmH [Phycisphaerae bacterium]|nr:16S rRNA (cytosine(1402)-N(4))-methyltransferase RsmH [Phycisphaerae bacterium]
MPPQPTRPPYARAVTRPAHNPVLRRQVADLLCLAQGQTFADATAGLGGHAADAARAVGPAGRIILNDLDPANLAAATRAVEALGVPVTPIHGNFAALPAELARRGIVAHAVLADVGFASNQVDDPTRGLSFSRPGPLDMRLNPASPTSAATLVASLSEAELADLIDRYGEERHARRVARRIVERRAEQPIQTTDDLAAIVRSAVGGRSGSIDPATRTFQALRIAVNDELGNLEAFVDQVRAGAAAAVGVGPGPRWLHPGARVAVISFHSLEDRIVKRGFEAAETQGIAAVLTRRPLEAQPDEIQANPRARSARLRALEVGPRSTTPE